MKPHLLRTGLAILLLSLSLPALAITVTLNPTADAYVQAGSNAAMNYGSNSQLQAQTDDVTVSNNYDSYLKFDTSSAGGNITSARLRLYASLSASGTVSTSVHAVANTTWGEKFITWNNKPALGASLGSISVNSTSYAWMEIDLTAYVQAEKIAGRNELSLALHNASTSSPTVRAYSRNATSNPPQLVIVINAAPTVSIATPVSGSSYTAPAGINLTANAADDVGVQKVEYFNGAALIGTATTPPYAYAWNNVAAGGYTLTAKATDNLGAATFSAQVSITVNPSPNIPPTVSLAAPANGSVTTAPATVVLIADAGDSDGSIQQVEFYNGANLLGTSTSAPYTYTWNNVAAGSYTLSAKATDNRGAVTASSAATITVNPPVAYGTYYIYADHLNTPRLITDNGDKAVWRWDADPFGNAAPNEDPDGDGVKFSYNLRFPGQYYDQETGLHYNYFRDYDPSTGRYVESDPIGLEGGLNTYTYVRGNPLSYIDPQGLAQQGVDPRELPRAPGEPRCSAGDASCAAGLTPPGQGLMPNTDPECLAKCSAQQALMCSTQAIAAAGVGGGLTWAAGGSGSVPAGTATYLICQWIVQPFDCAKKCEKKPPCSDR
jgi:RHS repeat-associated protein